MLFRSKRLDKDPLLGKGGLCYRLQLQKKRNQENKAPLQISCAPLSLSLSFFKFPVHQETLDGAAVF